ncbi:uncharacterized protein LOC111707467 [Eurytemora carolleeae]|uniref:uncharacterized protein LOC111707467 n=1 Tax=Eurytemora carolleeae TaxID=1294199 RepID=UPI000C78FB88|nr:uncharacterized protein LOC111707467 [Eurytemora carolleeae]|eukprot:XP_023336346.1 uncharacterized protein LOC111707467 [Eurytemora affinis]
MLCVFKVRKDESANSVTHASEAYVCVNIRTLASAFNLDTIAAEMKVLILSTIVGLGACAPDLFSGPPHHPHHSPYAPAPYHPAPAPYHPAPHYAPDPYEKLAPRPYAYEFGVQV